MFGDSLNWRGKSSRGGLGTTINAQSLNFTGLERALSPGATRQGAGSPRDQYFD
jgi:hypothetical protein